MGADIKQLRNRIKSVDSTLHLTRAMGLVASGKIRRAGERADKAGDYADAFGEAVHLLVQCPACKKSPYMQERDGGRMRLIVIAGDRGLAGGYNANVFRLLRDYPDAELIPIGKRACERFGAEANSSEFYTAEDALKLMMGQCEDFRSAQFDRLGIVSTEYVSMMSQETRIEWVLPLSADGEKGGKSVLFEPDEITIFNSVIPEYLAGVLMARVRESFLSEVAARRMAMDSAGKNAQQMIDDLQLEYNRARQGAITQEITEIVAGSGD